MINEKALLETLDAVWVTPKFSDVYKATCKGFNPKKLYALSATEIELIVKKFLTENPDATLAS